MRTSGFVAASNNTYYIRHVLNLAIAAPKCSWWIFQVPFYSPCSEDPQPHKLRCAKPTIVLVTSFTVSAQDICHAQNAPLTRYSIYLTKHKQGLDPKVKRSRRLGTLWRIEGLETQASGPDAPLNQPSASPTGNPEVL
jgi:hypothetical protein